MSKTEKIFKALMAGRIIRTRPIDQAEFGINQIPDSIRKLRNKYGHEMIERTMVSVNNDGRPKRVAEYRIPIGYRKLLRQELNA